MTQSPFRPPPLPALDRSPFSGITLILTLLLIAALAALPFVVGSVASTNRAAEARRDIACLAGALRDPIWTTTLNVQVLRGEGNIPDGDPQSQWFRAVGSLSRELAARGRDACSTMDPWLQSYLVNARPNHPLWVISAGANGILETAFEAETAAGDDITFRVP